MIQRPQSILMAVAAVLTSLTFFTWLWTGTNGDVTVTMTSFKMFTSQGGKVIAEKNLFYILIMGVVAFGMNIFTIFQYKKRPLQMKLTSVTNLILAGYIILIMVFGKNMAAEQYKDLAFTWHIFFFGPVIAYVLNMVAKFLIRKDEKLVKSIDRIR